jgi:hypothetical protein
MLYRVAILGINAVILIVCLLVLATLRSHDNNETMYNHTIEAPEK